MSLPTLHQTMGATGGFGDTGMTDLMRVAGYLPKTPVYPCVPVGASLYSCASPCTPMDTHERCVQTVHTFASIQAYVIYTHAQTSHSLPHLFLSFGLTSYLVNQYYCVRQF